MKISIAALICVTGLFFSTIACAESPLADAVEMQDETALRELLAKQSDVNASQVDGMTALHWAAHHDDLEAARQLLKAGAKASAKNRYDITPLYLSLIHI